MSKNTEQNDILNKVQQFNMDLYSFRDVFDVDITVYLLDATVLLEEDKEMLEGRITFREAAAALKRMKNNKSPGPVGFTK